MIEGLEGFGILQGNGCIDSDIPQHKKMVVGICIFLKALDGYNAQYFFLYDEGKVDERYCLFTLVRGWDFLDVAAIPFLQVAHNNFFPLLETDRSKTILIVDGIIIKWQRLSILVSGWKFNTLQSIIVNTNTKYCSVHQSIDIVIYGADDGFNRERRSDLEIG